MLKHNLVRYRLINEHMNQVRSGNLDVANRLLRLLCKGFLRVGLSDDAGCEAEILAVACGCRVRYNRSYSVALISF